MTMDRRQLLAGLGLAGAGAGLASAQPEHFPRIAEVPVRPLEAQIARLIIMGFVGADPRGESADAMVRHLEERSIGGVLMLRHNARERDPALALAARLRAASADAWLAIDQEGGVVQRLNAEMGFTRIPRATELTTRGLEAGAELFAVAARELADAGFNMNLAPIADLYDPANDAIGQYGRAYGPDPDSVATWCAAFIEAFEAQGVACAIKHFPGHGRSRGDSHDGYVDISDTWTFEEAAPFGQLMRSGHAHLMMGAHLINRRLEPDGLPVTLSRRVLHGLLRQVMGYEGVVITDDLDMGAIRHHYTREQAVIGALKAGNDLLLISNSANPDPDLPANVQRWVMAAIERGELSEERISEANQRLDALEGHVRG
ncbi:glycoside hydrolase family 3 N-terminal domain-containing protein [Glycocaulis sp.]|uniref:glycoside hydrolase family 3 N-terminal domain-containing protein n=1 Tax=Glycocaulis sp. TaxID=1969725 RepID=UPI003D1A7ED2